MDSPRSIESLSRDIDEAFCPMVRANLRGGDGLLAPVGHPVQADLFAAPCPLRGRKEGLHECRVYKRRSWFECECGANGTYVVYEALNANISETEAYRAICGRIGIDGFEDRTGLRRWYHQRMKALYVVPAWPDPPDSLPFETVFIAGCERPGDPIPSRPDDKASLNEILRTKQRLSLDFEHARDKLWASAGQCRDVYNRTGTNAVMVMYLLGDLLNRLRRIYVKAQSTRWSSSWSDDLEAFWAGRDGAPSARHLRSCARIFEAAEFPWQLASFASVEAVLKAIRNERNPVILLGAFKDEASGTSETMSVTLHCDKPLMWSTIRTELYQHAGCFDVQHLLAGEVPEATRESARQLSNIFGCLVRAGLGKPDYVRSIWPVLDVFLRLRWADKADACEVLDLVTFGLEAFACSDGPWPTWLCELQKDRAQAKEKTASPAETGPTTEVGSPGRRSTGGWENWDESLDGAPRLLRMPVEAREVSQSGDPPSEEAALAMTKDTADSDEWDATLQRICERQDFASADEGNHGSFMVDSDDERTGRDSEDDE